MTQCAILDNVALTPTNTCRSHIISNALGGRLLLTDSLSKDGDNLLRELVEQPLIDALSPLMTLLDASRQKGHNQSVTVQGEHSGKKYVFSFNESLQLQHPEYVTSTNADGTISVEIKARTKKEAGQLIARARKEFPELASAQLDIPEPTSMDLSERLKFSFEIGEATLLPGAYNALSLFKFKRLGAPPSEWRKYIEQRRQDSKAAPPRSFFMLHNPEWLQTTGDQENEIYHTLVLKSVAERRILFGYIELFGVMRVGSVLETDWDTAVEETYRVDVVTGRETTPPTIDESALSRATLDTATRADLWTSAEESMTALIRTSVKRQADAKLSSDLDAAINKALGPVNPNQLLQRDDLQRMVHEIMESVVKPRLK